MDFKKLKLLLDKRNYDDSSYHYGNDCPNKTYCISENAEKWEVFYKQNIEKCKLKIFDNESEACIYLHQLLRSDTVNTFKKQNIINLTQLKTKLDELGVKEGYYVLGKYGDEQSCILYNGSNWEVFSSDRGNKNDLQIFNTEREACEYFYNYLTGFDFVMENLKQEPPKKNGFLGKLGF